MKGQWIRCSLYSVSVMILLPWVTVRTVRSDAGFAVVLLLLFAADPLYCICSGVWAGKNFRKRWSAPFLSAVLFLAGTWLCFEPGEPAFVTYALFYLLLGLAAMLVSCWMTKRREKTYGKAG